MGFGALDNIYAKTRRTEALRVWTQLLLTLQLDEETGLRGFERTHDPVFLSPYFDAHRSLHATLGNIQALVAASSQQTPLITSFGQLSEQWERQYANPILAGRKLSEPSERNAKTLVDEMRLRLEEGGAFQNAQIDTLEDSARRIERNMELIVVLAVGTIAAFGYVMERRGALREERYVTALIAERNTISRISDWRSNVIAMLAHDFRSTLTVIDTTATLIEEFPSESEQQRRLGLIHKSVDQLAVMTEEALLMARVVSGALMVDRGPVDVIAMLGDVAERYRPQRTIEIEGPECSVGGDRSYLLRIFDNIVSNSIKYSGPHTPITIRVTPVERSIEIAVIDHGPGIDPDFLPYIFTEFWRPPRPLNVDGQGLGLFIVKKLVEAHSGSIELENHPGSGLTVCVRLPRFEERRSASRPA